MEIWSGFTFGCLTAWSPLVTLLIKKEFKSVWGCRAKTVEGESLGEATSRLAPS